ncbi:unnamed protein product [Rotaria sp. Silwood1]|nr:unnamed protein product [Rotaria sp. Silwood1]CAF3456097.1 unnamed protein product [Rotaria sp. Silwood1]CAF3505651.1 unnamed protein product [Rotaria sp. Silwood1]CAF4576891.1 unnamed protein product [Rotaria sp. Silwood1]CAF4665946.1 unnamed protein product [Rotaria sp. Silwood1]
MATVHKGSSNHVYGNKEHRSTSPAPHFNYETYYKHQEKQPIHTNPLLQYLSDTELKFRNDNLYETETYRLPRRTDILNRYIKMNPNFEHLNRVYEPNLTNIEKQRYRRCVEQQEQKLHRIKKKFDFQTSDGHNSHYFLTGARYNRFDTVDSKILLKYGTFVNRNNPEQVDIKATHFKKFREILQAQNRSSSTGGGGGGETSRKDLNYDLIGERKHEEDLEDLTNRYERSSSRQSNLKPITLGKRTKLPKIKDPERYVDAGSQMPERKRGRRSLERAISSSSTHRSSRHRRQSQHQQQQSPAQQSSVSYVANKVSFSLVNESNPPTLTTTNKQHEDEYELITTTDNDQHYQQQQQQHTIPHESVDDNDEEQEQEEQEEPEEEEENIEKNDQEDNPIVLEHLRQQATVIVSNILAAAIDQISLTSTE